MSSLNHRNPLFGRIKRALNLFVTAALFVALFQHFTILNHPSGNIRRLVKVFAQFGWALCFAIFTWISFNFAE